VVTSNNILKLFLVPEIQNGRHKSASNLNTMILVPTVISYIT